MTQNYEHASGSENPGADAQAELGKENGPVHLDVSKLDFSNIRETYSKIQDPGKAVEVEFSDTTQEIKTIITEEDGTERAETINTANPGDAIVMGKKGLIQAGFGMRIFIQKLEGGQDKIGRAHV